MRGRFDPLEIEGGDSIDMLEDAGQLSRDPLDIGLGDLDSRQPGDVEDLLAFDHARDSTKDAALK